MTAETRRRAISRRRLRRGTRRFDQLLQRSGGALFELVDRDGECFDVGMDITECGAVKFLHAEGADELGPYLRDGHYVQAEALGFGLERTKTLAWGCDRCDFRYTKDSRTTALWPPRFVERACGEPQTTTPESAPAS